MVYFCPMLDYLVVGLGLAGLSYCEQLEKHGKSFRVISDTSQQASLVAGGLYNPVILKRFTMAWKARQQMDMAMPFYRGLEEKLGTHLDAKIPVYRRFTSIEEQNNWFTAMDKLGLDHFLSPKILQNTNPRIDAPYCYGEVRYTGKVDTKALITAYTAYLEKKGWLQKETFEYEALEIEPNSFHYKHQIAKKIVFAEGYGLKKSPFFNYLPLNGTKGELLTIHAPELKEERVIKSSVFIIPLGEDLYRIGATYKWKDKTNTPTLEAKEELLSKLNTFLKCPYEVVKHVAGIRPTVADRRPLVGVHPKNQRMLLLNGLGSRGVLIAPYASAQLYQAVENGKKLDPEMDIGRFTKKWFKA